MGFFGRREIIDDLCALWGKRTSSLVTCRGRRRIGKSTLIERFAEISGARFIKIEGIRPTPKMSNADQLKNFCTQLAVQTQAERTPAEDWLNCFIRLDREIAMHSGRTVVLLDEVSWMAFDDCTFSGTLKVAWDNYFKKHSKLILVVCGSVSTWIKREIIDDGAFFGRRSLDVVVPELPLAECVKFWGRAAARIDPREIIDVLSVTGGVPRYLEEIDPGLTANENIRRLCFRPKSPLRVDFDEMYADVITQLPTLTAQTLRVLAEGPKTVTEISAQLKLAKSGHLSEALMQLEECGLVSPDVGKNPATGKAARAKFYRLKDNYTRFYLRYIEPAKETIDAGSYSIGTLDALDGWESVLGLAFENLVVNNVRALLAPLHLTTSPVLSAAPYRRSDGAVGKGVQVDLLLQTHRSIVLVEIKRQREIGREVIEEMVEKVRRLPKRRDISIRTALIYEGHVAPIVEADGYFDAIVPFRQLLGLA